MDTKDAEERFPNIAACAQGCTSGRWSEWPVLRTECGEVLSLLADKDAKYAGLLRDVAAIAEERDRLVVENAELRRLLWESRNTLYFGSHAQRESQAEAIDAALADRKSE